MPTFSPQDLARWSGGRWTSEPAAAIRGASADTRALPPGCLFIALRGPRFDAHDFLAQAFAAGAAAAVVDAAAALPPGCGPCLRVPDTAAALRAIATGHRRLVGCEIVAVTGSAGKSTVKEMIAAVLGRRGPVARTKGNWNNDIGLPLSLLTLEPGDRAGVFEAGSNHPGEIAGLARIMRPDWGVVTNVGPVHIEFFGGSARAVAEEKASLLAALPAGGAAVVGCDHDFADVLIAAAPCPVVTVSVRGPADYRCAGFAEEGGRTRIRGEERGRPFDLEIPVPGEHHVLDALLAAAVGRGHGMDWGEIGAALAGFQGMPMRWSVAEVGGFTVINDAFNANPLSMRASLRAFASFACAGRRWAVLGDMLELGEAAESEHRKLGRELAGGAWGGLVTVGPRAALIADEARRAGPAGPAVVACADVKEAARALLERLRPGDAILLKGSRGMRLEGVADELKARAAGGADAGRGAA